MLARLMFVSRGMTLPTFYDRRMLRTARMLQSGQAFIIVSRSRGSARLLCPVGIVYVDIDDLDWSIR